MRAGGGVSTTASAVGVSSAGSALGAAPLGCRRYELPSIAFEPGARREVAVGGAVVDLGASAGEVRENVGGNGRIDEPAPEGLPVARGEGCATGVLPICRLAVGVLEGLVFVGARFAVGRDVGKGCSSTLISGWGSSAAREAVSPSGDSASSTTAERSFAPPFCQASAAEPASAQAKPITPHANLRGGGTRWSRTIVYRMTCSSLNIVESPRISAARSATACLAGRSIPTAAAASRPTFLGAGQDALTETGGTANARRDTQINREMRDVRWTTRLLPS